MKRLGAILFLFLAFLPPCLAAPAVGTVAVKVVEKGSGEPLQSAVAVIRPYGTWCSSDARGMAVIQNVPNGTCELEVSLLGYVTFSREISVPAAGKTDVKVELEVMSLALEDVVVVAQSSHSGESTASKIGRQAIDHLQATSLRDLLQLLPGQVVTENPSLNSPANFVNRTLDSYDSNNAFGSSIMIDGIPVSNNADMNSRGGTYSTAGGGVDLRSIGTDDIESVEVIRGIPSAEYGDLSAGTMIINSKIGVTDLKLKAKIFPGVSQFYAGKGFKVGKHGSLNVNLDYANGKSDPRYTTDTYDRVLGSVIHSFQAGSRATFTTKFSTTNVVDWSGPDPAEIIQDVYSRTKENGFTFSHGGKFNTDCPVATNIRYDLSVSYKKTDSYTRSLTTGNQPQYDAREEGTRETVMLPKQYYGCGGTIGEPVNVYAKISDGFNLNTADSRFKNRFNIGAEYRMDGNVGKGFYNEDPLRPLSAAGYRARAFRDIPFLNQIVGYAEDNFELRIGKEYPVFKGQAGLRWTMIQPGRDERMQSLSPRLNTSLLLSKNVSVRFGYGLTEKTPSQLMIYPATGYLDISNLNCGYQGEWLGVYTTRLLDYSPLDLAPMRTNKYEAGVDVNTSLGQTFSVIAYYESTLNGFGSSNDLWTGFVFDKWTTDDVAVLPDGKLTYDREHPSYVDTTIVGISKTSNRDVHISKGLEFDFNLGKIKATGTSFYLSGAYSETEYHSSNLTYNKPIGSSAVYNKIFFVYEEGGTDNINRRFSTSLRIVQNIPSLNFVVSGTVQAVLYDYTYRKNFLGAPIGYLAVDDAAVEDEGRRLATRIYPLTAEQCADKNLSVLGYNVSDQVAERSAYSDRAESWPSLWAVNLRVTKDVTRFLGLSFYVNNLFFDQPWQKSSISTSSVERNGSLFSYGFEIYLNF